MHTRAAVLAFALLVAACGRGKESADPAAGAEDAGSSPEPVVENAAFRPETREFREWRAVCDNLGRCAAYAADGMNGGWVMITREAGASAPARVAASLAGWGDESTPRLTLDGRQVDPAADNGRDLAQALSQGDALTLSEGEQTVTLSLSGAAAALLWIDDKQGRVGTPTALMRRGDLDAGAVPGPAAPPRVTAAPAASQAGLPDEGVTLPASLERLPEVRTCTAEILPGMTPLHTVDRLGEGIYLWGVECFRGAYNLGQRFWITGEDGATPRPVDFPSATGESGRELVNAAFDPESGTLDAFARGRGLGDCGLIQHWVWTGQRFVLTFEKSMTECAGMTPDLWPTLYRAAAQ